MNLFCFNSLINLITISTLISVCNGSWFDSDQLELFDLVEEVNGTFYDFMQLNETSTASEVKKQFRVLSLRLHPDKNSEPDAEIKFRQLVSISEVLKDDKKRKQYDDILINGLPNWKSGLYYIRRARKLGLLEMSIIVSLILTVGHYLCLVAAFYEKSFEVNEVIKKKSKKLSSEEFEVLRTETMINFGARKPNIWKDNLVVKTVNCIVWLITSIPTLIIFCVNYVIEVITELKQKNQVNEEESEEVVKKIKKPKAKLILPDLTGHDDEQDKQISDDQDAEDDDNDKKDDLKSDEWTEEEISALIKLTKKFPGGTTQRWERIANGLCRPLDEVTIMAKKVNSGQIKVSKSSLEAKKVLEVTTNDVSIRDDGANGQIVVNSVPMNSSSAANWTQDEQVLLEKALLKYPKGTDERWDKIATEINGKSKEDCINRFKFVSELVKKKKLASNVS